MMPTLRPALAGLALSLGIATAAQAAPLTLAEALSRAEEASVAVQVQQLSVEAAEAQFLSDPRAGSPSLRLGLRDIPLLDAANAQPVDLSAKLRMPLPRPWRWSPCSSS